MDDFLWRLSFQAKQYFYYVPKEEGTFWIAVASMAVILICGSIKVYRWKKQSSMKSKKT